MTLTRKQFLSSLTVAAAYAAISPHFAMAQESTESEIMEMVLGAEDAPVTVTEYASFTCPHCANFHETVFPNLKADYIDTGKVRFVYREVYFDRFGLWAGMLARCGGPEKYFGMVDLFYKRQREWAQSSADPATVVEGMKKLGRVAGMSDEHMDACLQDSDQAKALVAAFQKNAEADGIDSTPSLVIGGVTHDNMPYAELRELLDEQLDG
ncbi:MAG: DsbA family protein [Rhodobacteraceae bacterium]|nr:DsbA family protein [Paracoccaceae bacterium]